MESNISKQYAINATVENRKLLRKHAKEAMKDYSPVMTWLLVTPTGNLIILEEPQGQSFYAGEYPVISTTGSFYKASGDGAARNECGEKYKTQKEFLQNLLGCKEYERIFDQNKKGDR